MTLLDLVTTEWSDLVYTERNNPNILDKAPNFSFHPNVLTCNAMMTNGLAEAGFLYANELLYKLKQMPVHRTSLCVVQLLMDKLEEVDMLSQESILRKH